MRKILIAALAILPAIASATVPHTFIANSPARASEVNANFSNLDNRVTSLEAGTSSQGCLGTQTTLSYSKIATNIGDTFVYDSVDYVIVAIPVHDVFTGKFYKVKYAAKATDISNGDVNLAIYSYGGYNNSVCQNLTVDGYAAASTAYFSSYARGGTNNNMTWDTSYTVNVSIQIGNVYVGVAGATEKNSSGTTQ